MASFLTTSFTEAYAGVHNRKNIASYCAENYHTEVLETLLVDPNYAFYFATKAEREVGVLILRHHACPIRKSLKASELKQLYLRSSEYGTGLGKYVIQQAFQLALDRGNEWMWLCVSDLNPRAQRFYQKMDFSTIGTGPVLGVGTDRLNSTIMLRKLIS